MLKVVSSFLLPLFLLLAGCAKFDGKIRESGSAEAAEGKLWPGQQPDGSMLLPNQWSLKPAGDQIPVSDFPVNLAVHPSGRFVAVLHSGFSAHSVWIIDLQKLETVSRTPIRESFYGLEFDAAGKRACSAAVQAMRLYTRLISRKGILKTIGSFGCGTPRSAASPQVWLWITPGNASSQPMSMATP